MAILLTCSCGKHFRTKEANAGKRTRCPNCGVILAIPTPTTPAQGQASPAAEDRRCPNCNKPCPMYREICKQCGFPIGRDIDPATIDEAAIHEFRKRSELRQSQVATEETMDRDTGNRRGRSVLIGLGLWAGGLALVSLGLWLAVAGINEGEGVSGVAMCGGALAIAGPLFKVGLDYIRGMV